MTDDNLLAIFQHRTNLLLQRSAMRLQSKLLDKNTHPLDAWNDSQVFYLHHLAKAYGEQFGVMMFHRFLQKIKTGEVKTNEDTTECMQLLYQLHCVSRIDADLGTFRDGDYLTSEHGDWVKDTILSLCSKLKRHAISLVDAFYPCDGMMDSMIAPGDGDLYGSILNRLYYTKDAFGKVKNWKECSIDETKG